MTTFTVRDGQLDVVIVAGPRAKPWPSAGVRALSSLCAEMGLSVGMVGGENLFARGVLPNPGTGGLVLAEDSQHRIHRIHARAVVKVSQAPMMPDPFPGWRSQALIPYATAARLLKESRASWSPTTVILGTSNRALKFGSELLEKGPLGGAQEVYCVETHMQWSGKRYAGWEVERRRFEQLGGKMIEAQPVSLQPKAALLWELRLQDAQGVRVIEAARVVAAGPYRDLPGVREYPPGSFLFELEQSAAATREEDFEGWTLEEERGRFLAGKIVRALVSDLGPKKDELEKILRRARSRIRRTTKHRDKPFNAEYQGKWMTGASARELRSFTGVPEHAHKARAIASVECIEEIACNLCEKACPEKAIKWERSEGQRVLNENDCTACGLCLPACPSGSTLLVREQEDRSTSQLTLTWRGSRPWKQGEFATLVNRRGETLGSARITQLLPLPEGETDPSLQLVQLDVPTHLLWEARGLKRSRVQNAAAADKDYTEALYQAPVPSTSVEITLNGEKRLVREKIPVSLALFEIGQARPEDVLFCPDGSCGLCHLEVDGVKKLACQTQIRKGMAMRLNAPTAPDMLCACQGVARSQVVERMKQGHLSSPEAVVSVTHVGAGKCHGQMCGESFRRTLIEQGVDASQWIDWRFPWSDWALVPTSG